MTTLMFIAKLTYLIMILCYDRRGKYSWNQQYCIINALNNLKTKKAGMDNTGDESIHGTGKPNVQFQDLPLVC